MRRLIVSTLVILSLALFGVSLSQASTKEDAMSWQKQAKDTRATVAGVISELDKLAPQAPQDAKELIADAKLQLERGDEEYSKAEKAMGEGKFDEATSGYNMAWQYYVKSATAALNANRIITGK
ncbi:MAG: hypothetical protein QXX77_10810 [Candidatus Methanosuratincola sp.]|jgi:hypothetical protein